MCAGIFFELVYVLLYSIWQLVIVVVIMYYGVYNYWAKLFKMPKMYKTLDKLT